MANSESQQHFVELTRYALRLVRVQGATVEVWRECAPDNAAAVADALEAWSPGVASQSVRAVVGVSADPEQWQAIGPGPEAEAAVKSLSEAAGGAVLLTGANPDGRQARDAGRKVLVGAIPSSGLDAVRTQLQGWNIDPIRIESALLAGVEGQDIARRSAKLGPAVIWAPTGSRLFLLGDTGIEETVDGAPTMDDIFGAVQAALGLRVRGAASRLFFNEGYDFSKTGAVVGQSLSATLRAAIERLGGTPAASLGLIGLPGHQQWLLREVAGASGLAPIDLDLGAVSGGLGLKLDGSVISTAPGTFAAGLLRTASNSAVESRSWREPEVWSKAEPEPKPAVQARPAAPVAAAPVKAAPAAPVAPAAAAPSAPAKPAPAAAPIRAATPTPAAPATPVRPATAAPAAPATPVRPATAAATPVRPATPAPAAPATPVRPAAAAPSAGATPVRPATPAAVGPATPARPATPAPAASAPVARPATPAPAAPATPARPAAPAAAAPTPARPAAPAPAPAAPAPTPAPAPAPAAKPPVAATPQKPLPPPPSQKPAARVPEKPAQAPAPAPAKQQAPAPAQKAPQQAAAVAQAPASKPKSNKAVMIAVAAVIGVGLLYGGWRFMGASQDKEIATEEAKAKSDEQGRALQAVRDQLAQAEKEKADAERASQQAAVAAEQAKVDDERQAQARVVAQEESDRLRLLPGFLNLVADPADSSVSVDGGSPLPAPVQNYSLSAGAHQIRVTHAGYDPLDTQAVITGTHTTDLGVLRLVAATGSLSIDSGSTPSDFAVRATGSDTVLRSGHTPGTVDGLDPGSYTVTFSRDGWKDEQESTLVSKRSIARVVHTWTNGSLVIDSDPEGAEVRSDDGTLLGTTPFRIDDHPAGSMNLEFSLPDYDSAKKVATIEPGAAANVQVALLRTDRIAEASEIVTKPKPLSFPMPSLKDYDKVGGIVTVSLVISRDGSVHDVTVVDPQPPTKRLGRLYTQAVTGWTFQPALGADGNPLNVRIRIPIPIPKIAQADQAPADDSSTGVDQSPNFGFGDIKR